VGTIWPDVQEGMSVEQAVLGVEGFRRTGRYYDPTIFRLQPVGFWGNAGRSILIGPNFVNVDWP